MRTRVKICGITRPEDARVAVEAGADAIGLVFDPQSPRCLTIARAQQISAAVPPFVTLVALFVDAPDAQVAEVIQQVRPGLLQFHGSESPEQCRRAGRAYVKAIPMRSQVDLHAEERRYHDAAGLVLDAFVPGQAGGSGHTFDWQRIPHDLNRPVILAGGLTPANVADAIRRVRPSAVDVSSGVESAKGIKDREKIFAFVHAAHHAS